MSLHTIILLYKKNANYENKKKVNKFLTENLPELVNAVTASPHLRLSGLMAIPPAGKREEENIYYFSKMRYMFLDMQAKKLDNSNVQFLSMGMSGDFETAITCGANIIRLGTALFGKRK